MKKLLIIIFIISLLITINSLNSSSEYFTGEVCIIKNKKITCLGSDLNTIKTGMRLYICDKNNKQVARVKVTQYYTRIIETELIEGEATKIRIKMPVYSHKSQFENKKISKEIKYEKKNQGWWCTVKLTHIKKGEKRDMERCITLPKVIELKIIGQDRSTKIEPGEIEVLYLEKGKINKIKFKNGKTAKLKSFDNNANKMLRNSLGHYGITIGGRRGISDTNFDFYDCRMITLINMEKYIKEKPSGSSKSSGGIIYWADMESSMQYSGKENKIYTRVAAIKEKSLALILHVLSRTNIRIWFPSNIAQKLGGPGHMSRRSKLPGQMSGGKELPRQISERIELKRKEFMGYKELPPFRLDIQEVKDNKGKNLINNEYKIFWLHSSSLKQITNSSNNEHILFGCFVRDLNPLSEGVSSISRFKGKIVFDELIKERIYKLEPISKYIDKEKRLLKGARLTVTIFEEDVIRYKLTYPGSMPDYKIKFYSEDGKNIKCISTSTSHNSSRDFNGCVVTIRPKKKFTKKDTMVIRCPMEKRNRFLPFDYKDIQVDKRKKRK